MVASDIDDGRNGEVTYELYESNSSLALLLFALHPQTGELTMKQSATEQSNVHPPI